MAGTLYTITLTTPIADIIAAMTAKYGLYDASTNPTGLSIKYQSTTSLIFTCEAITNKYIRINFAVSPNVTMQFGTAWTSGDTITGSIEFLGSYTTSAITAFYLVLYSDMLAAFSDSSTTGNQRIKAGAIGKLSNGDYYLLGMSATDGSSTSSTAINTTTGAYMAPIGLTGKFMSQNNKIMTQPLYLYNMDTGQLYVDGNGNKVSVNNIQLCSTGGASGRPVIASSYAITACSLVTYRIGVAFYITGATNGILMPIG